MPFGLLFTSRNFKLASCFFFFLRNNYGINAKANLKIIYLSNFDGVVQLMYFL